MKIHELPGDPGRQQKRKRVGRGRGSGHGKTSTKGHKGHSARSGGGKGNPFEGGQMPIVRRVPKFGFKNPFRVEYEVVNVSSLEKKFEAGETVDVEAMRRARLASGSKPVKVLANGEISKALNVKAHKASETAIKKLSDAGGSFEQIKD
jgi:large subunit ribosomal protein L15